MLPRTAFVRTLVIGNSGAGKSWLSARLADALGSPAIDLDEFVWAPGGLGIKLPEPVAIENARRVALRPEWIIEGVYGWLGREIVDRATAVLWFDLPVEECLRNIRLRGPRRGGGEKALVALLAWAAEYPTRQTSSSLRGHGEIFEAFAGSKRRISSREECEILLCGFLR